jgi:hypothetical protein
VDSRIRTFFIFFIFSFFWGVIFFILNQSYCRVNSQLGFFVFKNRNCQWRGLNRMAMPIAPGLHPLRAGRHPRSNNTPIPRRFVGRASIKTFWSTPTSAATPSGPACRR